MFRPDERTSWVFSNHIASTVTAKARVTTAKGRPRTRSAGSPTRTPIPVATSAASIGAMGNGMPQLSVIGLRMKPATPARVSWANET